MGPIEFHDLLECHPFLTQGIPDHREEVLRIAQRLLVEENSPIVRPDLAADAPPWEHAWWARWAARGAA